MNKKEVKRLDPFSQYALAAAHQAIDDADLPLKERNPNMGVMVGTGIGGLTTIEAEKTRFIEYRNNGNHASSRVSPTFIPIMMPNAASANISMKYKMNNSCLNIGSACATGLHSIIYATKDILLGDADVMIAGGAEAPFTPLAVGSFMNMKALCRDYNEEPKKASRPFDLNRKGFVMGEGAGVLVLENLEYALKRGARIYAEIAGYGSTADAHHITSQDPACIEIARAMKKAIDMAGISSDEVDYINAHGTSTAENDVSETKAIKQVMGDYAYKVRISSTKSVMGHLIGAAGAVETIACLLAMAKGLIPPTINQELPDPKCDLNYVPNRAERADINIAMNNSFGFGGHNAVVVLRRN
jgi:3-oxoacyl-[acyl-carrier-protein] synthase II